MIRTKTISFFRKTIALLLLVGLIACKTEEHKGRIIAKVGDKSLYSGDVLFLSYSSVDSAEVVSNYVNKWIEKEILVLEATNSAAIDQKGIERKVANYKADLLIHELENQRIESELNSNITKADIETYYKEHEDDFQLNDYLVKVLYLKIPLDAPEIEKIESAYKLRLENDLATIDEYAKSYASNFYYDIDSWIYFDDLLKEIPLHDINKDRFILKRSKIRFEENGFYYFLNIVDYKLKNTLSPISFERDNIKERIMNNRVKALREKIKKDIIKRHMKNGRLSVIKGTFFLFLFIIGGSLQSFAQGQGNKAVIIDKIVAQIGNEIILLSDIQAQRLSMIQNGLEGDQQADCEILEEFLFEKLLVNQAKIDSVDIPSDMVNQEMERRIQHIASQIGSIEKLEEFYGKPVAKIKAEFFEMIKKRMLAEQMQDIITENVTITPKEVEKFYNSLPADSIPDINAKLKIAQIVYYPKISEKDKEITRIKLNNIREEVIRGDLRFESAASIYSDDPGSRADGGNLGWQTRGNMVPEFEAALFNLKTPLDISDVFETQYGYHIVQLIERKGDNYKSRHILLMNKVSNEALTKASLSIDSLYNQIRLGNISFTDAARRFSNDEDSKYNGGQIVNPYSGDYLWDINNLNEIDPQMSQLVQSMKIGDMSSPALYINYMEQSKQGIRFVKLLDRTEPHVANLKTDRQLIEMAAMSKKKQQVIDKWIETKINGNFIQIDEEYQSACKYKYHWIKTK